MQCIILATSGSSFPSVLLPVKGRAVIDYLIDDALLQKEIETISVSTSAPFVALIKKHLQNAFPQRPIEVASSPFQLTGNDDIVVLQGNISTSLKLQDFIRYYRQFKTIAQASYDKNNPHTIPFTIFPKGYTGPTDSIPPGNEVHTYNSGSGYCNEVK